MTSPIGSSKPPRPLTAQVGSAPAPRLRVIGNAAAPSARATWAPPLRGEWSTDPDGSLSDPVNLYLHGSLDQVRQSFEAAGWTEARPKNLENSLRFGLFAIPGFLERGAVNLWNKITGRHDQLTNSDPLYHEVNSEPVDPLEYNGKPEVAAFEKDNNPFGGRHHLRIFDTGKVDDQGQPVWAVAASRDIGLKFDVHRIKTLFLDHVVQPNADMERDVVLRDLRAGNLVKNVQTHTATWPDLGPEHLHSEDGKVYDVQLS